MASIGEGTVKGYKTTPYGRRIHQSRDGKDMMGNRTRRRGRRVVESDLGEEGRR